VGLWGVNWYFCLYFYPGRMNFHACRIIETERGDWPAFALKHRIGNWIRSMSSGKYSARDRVLGTLEIECRSCG
jgi:hypothetical protein